MKKVAQIKGSLTRIIAAGIFLFLLAFPLAGSVRAHGVLVRSEPVDGSLVPEPPGEIRLWFNEPVSGRFSSVTLYDRDGQPIPVEDLRADPRETGLLVARLPRLAAGTYSVLWKALSETDGHFSEGLVVFSIGTPGGLDGQPSRPADAGLPPLPEVILRWLIYATLAGMVGALTVGLLVFSPLMKQSTSIIEYAWTDRALRRVLSLGGICAGAAIPVSLGMLGWQILSLAQAVPGEVPYLELGSQVLLLTRWGQVWIVRVILLTLLAVTFARIRRAPSWQPLAQAGKPAVEWARSLAIVLVSTLALAQAQASHAAGLRTNTGLAVLMDALHILAVGAWVGGTLSLAYASFPVWRQEGASQADLLRKWWGSFSPAAAFSVGLLVSTGLYNAGREVASVDALLLSPYGQVLLAKVGLVLLMGLMGLLNASLLHPALFRPLAGWFRRSMAWTSASLGRLSAQVLVEGALGLLVLLLAGSMTASPPPLQADFTIPENVPATLSRNVDDLVITLNAKPNRPGENVFTVLARSTRRPPPAEISRVILRFSSLDSGMGKKSVIGKAIAPDRYLVGGSYLSMPGRWQVEVVIRRLGLEDSVARFDWIVPPLYSRPTLVSKARLESALTVAAALLLGFVAATTATAWALNRKRLRPRTKKVDSPRPSHGKHPIRR